MKTIATLAVAFLSVVGLKLFGAVAWSWLWVLSPIWAIVAVPVLLFVAVLYICAVMCVLIGVSQMMRNAKTHQTKDKEGGRPVDGYWCEVGTNAVTAPAVSQKPENPAVPSLRSERLALLFGDEKQAGHSK